MAPRAPEGHFTILYFATASSFTGKSSEFLRAPLEVGGLFEVLEERYKGFKEKVLVSCLVTVNLEYVDIAGEAGEGGKDAQEVKERGDSTVIQEGDEVAIIPPVSSG